MAKLRDMAGVNTSSYEHFSVDGTLLEEWASQKSFVRRRATRTAMAATSTGRPTVRHACLKEEFGCTPDTPRRRSEAELSGHALMENRRGHPVCIDVRHASSTGERDGPLALVDEMGNAARR